MFGKSKVSQSMIDAVNKVLGEQPVEQKEQLLNEAGAPIKEPTPTGVRVYGGSYGNSAKAKKDQTKSPVDNLKGPKDKEMKEELKSETFEFHLTEGSYADLHKKWGDTHNIEYHSHTLYPKHTVTKFDNEKDAESHAKKNAGTVRMSVSPKMKNEELKGNQDKIDANHNDKIDAQDFKILKAKKKVKEGREFTEKLLEMVRKSDVPAYLRKAKGDTPLTMADVKAPKKDTISDPKNLAKANEAYDVSKIAPKPFKHDFKHDHDSLKSSLKRPKLTTGLRQSKISPGETEVYIKNSYEVERIDELKMKPVSKPITSYGGKPSPYAKPPVDKLFPGKSSDDTDMVRKEEVVNEAKGIIVKKEYDDKKEAEHGVYHNGNKIGYIVHNKKHDTHTAYHSPQGDPEDNDYGQIDDFHSHHDAVNQIRHSAGVSVHEEVENEAYVPSDAPITTDTLAGRMPGGKSNSFKSFKTRVKPLAKQEGETETPDTKDAEKTSARSSIKAEEVQVEATIAGISGFKPMKQDVKDKSGAVHTPMSRAKDLARQAFKTVQNKTKVK